MGGLKTAVGQRIRSIRQELRLTLEKAADRAGMDPKYWGRCERGEKNLTLETIERMLKALGAEPLELFTVDKSKHKEEGELIRSLMQRMSASSRKQLLTLAKHLSGTRR